MPAPPSRRTGRLLALVAIAASALIGQVLSTPGSAHAAGRCTATVAGARQVGRFGGIVRRTYRGTCGRAAARAAATRELPYEQGTKPPLRLAEPTAKVM